jgi:hypothetical protein
MIIGECYKIDHGDDVYTIIKILDKNKYNTDIWALLIKDALGDIVNEKLGYDSDFFHYHAYNLEHIEGYNTNLYKALNETE